MLSHGRGRGGIYPDMANPLKLLIEKRLEVLGKTARAASLEVGAPEGFIKGILKQPDTHHPRTDTLSKLAAALELPLEDVLEAASGATMRGDVKIAPPILFPERTGAMPRDVPVMGTAAGSVLGGYDFRFEGGVIDYVRRPPALAGAKDIYAIFVTGSSMEPKFSAGDLCFINPHRPPAIGDTVIIQIRPQTDGDPEAYIKHLVRRTADKVIASQLNPEGTIEFKAPTVIAIHKVLSMNELFGV